MKKFILTAVILVLCLMGIRYAVYYRGFYIDLHPDAPIHVHFKTDQRNIYIKNQEDKFEEFIIKGVDLASSIPGHYATDYAVDKDTWLRWFSQIQEMGSNTIRTYTIYDDTFYNAFYEYNVGREEPLYLLQGIQVSDYANNSGQDAYSRDYYEVLKEDSLDAVDIVHGRKNISINQLKGSGTYRKDISPWVIGYLIGNDWNSGTMAYTNHNSKHSKRFVGTYFTTTQEATAFEVMLAKIMDNVVAYESKKYKTQRLVSFNNDPKNDPFEYEITYAKQLGKYNQLDAEHMKATQELKSGYFASYQLYKFMPEFSQYFSPKQKQELTNRLMDLNRNYYYDGYTELLAEYHTIPVVIAGYGFSSARGTEVKEGPMTEEEQGQALIDTYQDIVASGCSGAFINSWQDTWERPNWNTSYAVELMESYRWQDVQNSGQGYGLLSFDAGEKESACYVDGDPSEWNEMNRIIDSEEITLSAKYDSTYLYMLLEKKGLTKNSPVYITIDITPNSGSRASRKPALTFEREVDFLICLNGPGKSRLLVQERYESIRENYLAQITGEDPFVSYPNKDSDEFVPVRMICKNNKIAFSDLSQAELKKIKLFDTFETGKLTMGNGNPGSSEYNSLADLCYGSELVEVRIPWQLLNFYNPADRKIHDDYYVNYGVEGIVIDQMYVGISEPDQKTGVPMAALKLEGWGKEVAYHERLKQSYYIMKENWGE